MIANTKESKHVACARCRERKVRCDGEKPSCRRCVRHGQTCQYVRGKKQQVKNEWVQHLRTFSAQPVKKKPQATPRSSAPRTLYSVVQQPTPEYLPSDSLSYSSRDSSPYYEQTTPDLVHASPGHRVACPVEVAGDTQDWVVATSDSPASLDPNFMEPSNFVPCQPALCATEYVPNGMEVDYTTTIIPPASVGAGYHMAGALRADTPGSQASDEASLEYYFDPMFPYAPAQGTMSSTNLNDWTKYYYTSTPYPLVKAPTTDF